MMVRTAGLLIAALLIAAPAFAQAAAAPAPAAGAAGQAAPPPQGQGQGQPQGRGAIPGSQTPIEPPGYDYDPQGRRDPFVSLLRRGTTAGASAVSRPAGLAGLQVDEIMLRGTVRSREGYVGILQGSDQRTYIVRPGDKLFDGTIRTITQNDMVIVQQVNDPLSLDKQREVRKVLRQTEAN